MLADAYRPTGLTVLLVFSDATAEVRKNLAGEFQLGLTSGELNCARRPDGRQAASARANPRRLPGPSAGERTLHPRRVRRGGSRYDFYGL